MINKIVVPLLFVGVVLLIAVVAYINLNASLKEEFTLYREDGVVFYKLPGDTGYTQLESDEKALTSGSVVKTETGYAHIVFPDKSMMSLDQNTEIQVNLDDENVSVTQLIGNTWHRVQELSSGDEYTIETATAVAAVRGTTFAVESTVDQTDIYVTEDEVEISQYFTEENKKILKNTQMLPNGKFISVPDFRVTEEISIVDTPENIRESVWYKRNTVIDEEFGGTIPKRLLVRLRNLDTLKQYRISQSTVQTTTVQDIWEGAENRQEIREQKDVYAFLTDIKAKYDLEIAGELICEHVASDQYADDLSRLSEYEDVLGSENVQIITEYLQYLERVCEDGEISDEERSELEKNFYHKQNSANPVSRTDPAFEKEINTLLETYIKLIPESADACSPYANKSVEDILAEFEDVEEKYNVEPQIVAEISDGMYEIKTACEDGVLSEDEIDAIQALLPERETTSPTQ